MVEAGCDRGDGVKVNAVPAEVDEARDVLQRMRVCQQMSKNPEEMKGEQEACGSDQDEHGEPLILEYRRDLCFAAELDLVVDPQGLLGRSPDGLDSTPLDAGPSCRIGVDLTSCVSEFLDRTVIPSYVSSLSCLQAKTY
jgi:hypothetical protein